MLTYRVQYAPAGKATVTTTYKCNQPLEAGQWLDIDGIYVVVERVVRGKPGDAYAGVVLCKVAIG